MWRHSATTVRGYVNHRRQGINMRGFRSAVWFVSALLVLATPVVSTAQILTIAIAPPELPVYVQPAIPEPGYMWSPGIWISDETQEIAYVPEPPAPLEIKPTTAQPDPNTVFVPGYWVFNAMAKYPLSERTSLQLNLNNLANKYYYDQIHPGHIVPGAGFNALIGINFKF